MSDQFLYAGCGSMARRRLRHVHENWPGATLNVYDIRDDRMNEVADMFPVNKLTGFDDVDPATIKGLFVCVPPASHEIYIEWALENNVPFMVEQPISHELGRLQSIRERAAETDLIVHVSNNHRHSGRIGAIKRILDSGEVGRPLTAMVAAGEYLPDWHSYEPYTDYYPSRQNMGGGLDAVCEVDWLRELFGEVTDVVCIADKKSDLDIDTLDTQQFIINFENDGPQVSLHIDMLNRHYHAELRILCEKGTIEHRMPESVIRLFRADGKSWEDVPMNEDWSDKPSMQGKEDFNFVEPMYEADTVYFLDQIKSGKADMSSLDSGIRNISIVEPLIAEQLKARGIKRIDD